MPLVPLVAGLVLAAVPLGCREPDPILAGLGPSPEVAVDPASAPTVHRAGLALDVPWVLGRAWEEVRLELPEHLGPVTEVVELGSVDGREVRLQRGRVRLLGQDVYLVEVALPAPLARSEALEALGIPPTVETWFDLSQEYRVTWHAGYERLRFGRTEADSELVAWVEVLERSPRDHQR